MSVIEPSTAAVLAERAQQQPDAPAYTFIDYERDPAGFSTTLTWSEVHQRAQVVAAELASCGSPGDRVAILAPHGLNYIIGFLGAMEAGLIAVPLSAPQFDMERVVAVLKDSSPVALLTTLEVVDAVDSCAQGLPGSLPAVIAIDALDFYAPPAFRSTNKPQNKTAMLQYTSGSTRAPTGVMISHQNLRANFEQTMSDFFDGKAVPPDTTVVSWLPFYHDMGLSLALREPILFGIRSVLMSPVSFLQRPARWMQLLASNSRAFSAAPNFAFELAARKTSDHDMVGLDLGDVLGILSGSERIQPATLRRFSERFSRYNFPESALRPSYGLAEATVYVATRKPGHPPEIVHFESEKLSLGIAERSETESGTALVSYGVPRSPMVRIVDPETRIENPAGKIGEIWVHGDNVADGYWRNPELTKQTFNARIIDPLAGTPQVPWLRTGDLGVISDSELFIVGRIKDVLIVDGRNHYPDDIEATIQEITGGRVAAISVPNDRSEQLVAVVEIKKRGSSDEEILAGLRTVKREVTSAVSKSHGLRLADLVLVGPGSIPITTSGKVRRSTCAQRYRQDEFTRLDMLA